MATLYHQVWISASRETLYEAITTDNGIGGWWDRPKIVATDAGPMLDFSPGPEHGTLRMKVVEATEGKRVEWEFISTHPESSIRAKLRQTSRLHPRLTGDWFSPSYIRLLYAGHSGTRFLWYSGARKPVSPSVRRISTSEFHPDPAKADVRGANHSTLGSVLPPDR